MRYYICIEEDRIWYVRGRFKRYPGSGRQRRLEIVNWESVEPVPDMVSVLTYLSGKYGLEGKRVSLVTGRGLKSRGFTIPKAGKDAMRNMAANELALMDADFKDCALAVDMGTKRQNGMVPITAYYIENSRLDEYKEALSKGRMTCSRILVMPDCMALMARELWKEERILLINAAEGSVGFYVLSGGHCLACRMTALKTGRFLREGALTLLYEEMADQIGALLNDSSVITGEFTPECVVLMASVLPHAEDAAMFLERKTGVPCEVRMPEVMGECAKGRSAVTQPFPGDVNVQCLAACVAGSLDGKKKALELVDLGYAGEGYSLFGAGASIPRGWFLFLLANVLAAASLSLHAVSLDRRSAAELAEADRDMEEIRYSDQVLRAQRMERELEARTEYRENSRTVREMLDRENVLGIEGFKAFTGALEPGMGIESMVFDSDKMNLQMTVSMEYPEDVPAYVDRVRASGVFLDVGHGLWEKKTDDRGTQRVYAVVYGTLGTGGTDEAQ